MKAFPGLTPDQIDEIPAVTWDWLIAIDTEVSKGKNDMMSKVGK